MNSRHARFGRVLFASIALLAVAFGPISSTAAAPKQGPLGNFKHIVVIYEENHSFDNLYGGWEGVNGLANADAAHTTQAKQNGSPCEMIARSRSRSSETRVGLPLRWQPPPRIAV